MRMKTCSFVSRIDWLNSTNCLGIHCLGLATRWPHRNEMSFDLEIDVNKSVISVTKPSAQKRHLQWLDWYKSTHFKLIYSTVVWLDHGPVVNVQAFKDHVLERNFGFNFLSSVYTRLFFFLFYTLGSSDSAKTCLQSQITSFFFFCCPQSNSHVMFSCHLIFLFDT